MSLTLHLHPLSSFCHKVLVALYENDTAFEARTVDFANPASRAQLMDLSPMGKIPVLHDTTQDRAIAETSIIIEYLDDHFPGKRPLLPRDATARLDARFWDRFFDLYIHIQMQKLVADRLRPAGQKDPKGVEDAVATINTAYGMIERQLDGRTWVCGDDFTIADCSASPALFYAGIVNPFPADHVNLRAYFERLLDRPAFARVLVEARPYFSMFPFREEMPARFLGS